MHKTFGIIPSIRVFASFHFNFSCFCFGVNLTVLCSELTPNTVLKYHFLAENELDCMECQGSNLGQPYARHILYPLYYLSQPKSFILGCLGLFPVLGYYE